MENTINIKNLSKEDIEKLTDVQLYNILFGPLIDMKKEIEQDGKYKDNSVVAVYGATIVPIKRRVRALNQLSEFVDLDNGVIFSGGSSWDSVNPKRFKNIEEIKEYWKSPKYTKWISAKVASIIKNLPEIKEIIENKMEEDYISNMESNMHDNYDTESINNFKEEYRKNINDIYTLLINNLKTNENMKKLYEQEETAQTYEEWLYNWVENYVISQYILNNMTEADFMEIDWISNYKGNLKSSNIIKDGKSNDTSENARNTIEEFVKLKSQNPKLNKLIVVTEWPYLLRQVLTTKKMAEKMGYDNIDIVGYPADVDEGIGLNYKDISDYRKGIVSGLEANIYKIVSYDDVKDLDITDYYYKSSIIENGPTVFIDDKDIRNVINDKNDDIEH